MARQVKRFACLTDEQQEYFDKLPGRQQQYVRFRGQGYNRPNSYKMAGYEGKGASQAAYMLEKRNSGIVEIINAMLNASRARQIEQDDSKLNRQIDALAQQDGVEKMLETIEGADGETAKRIQFYRDIVNGKIDTVKVTRKYGPSGELVSKTVEHISDVDAKVRARKELDRILGINEVLDIGALQMGDITINIVDASKKEELEDSRNQINLNPDDVEVVDGEKVIVEEEKVEKEDDGTRKE